MGEGDCAARGRKSAAAGVAAGPASDGISAARLAGTAEDSARKHTDLHTSSAGVGEPEVGEGRGEGLRDESSFDCGALPSRDSRGRKPGRVSLGTIAEGAIAGSGAQRGVAGAPAKKNCLQEKPIGEV